MLNFKVSTEDRELIDKIVDRAVECGLLVKKDKMWLIMDLTACHNSCPLRLKDLLEGDRIDFIHDVAGIHHHLNRDTGELMDFFLPRYAAPEGVKA
jgi:hypothetical protein